MWEGGGRGEAVGRRGTKRIYVCVCGGGGEGWGGVVGKRDEGRV